MREELERAWAEYQAVMRAPRSVRSRADQDRASTALIDATNCQAEFDRIARRVIGLEGADHAASATMLLQGHVVVPYIHRHRFEHDVLEYALAQDWPLLWAAGVFDDFADYDRVGGDERLGARYYLLTRVDLSRHWRALLAQRVQSIDFALHELGGGLGPLEPPEFVVRELLAATALVEQAPAGTFEPFVGEELETFRAELVDWLIHDGLGRPGEFDRWCAARGSTHRFSRAGPPPLMRSYVHPVRTRRDGPQRERR